MKKDTVDQIAKLKGVAAMAREQAADALTEYNAKDAADYTLAAKNAMGAVLALTQAEATRRRADGFDFVDRGR